MRTRDTGVSHPYTPGVTPDQLARYWAQVDARSAAMHGVQEAILAELRKLTNARPKPSLQEPISLNAPAATPSTGMPYTLNTRGYAHNRLWSGATGNLLVDAKGIKATVALVIGWNPLDLPDQAILTVASGNVLAILELTDSEVA